MGKDGSWRPERLSAALSPVALLVLLAGAAPAGVVPADLLLRRGDALARRDCRRGRPAPACGSDGARSPRRRFGRACGADRVRARHGLVLVAQAVAVRTVG